VLVLPRKRDQVRVTQHAPMIYEGGRSPRRSIQSSIKF
jgi:hypothetical protein